MKFLPFQKCSQTPGLIKNCKDHSTQPFNSFSRATCTGICSGAARLGAITGIIIGEMKLLHSSFLVNILAGIVTLISALLIKVLPDMTKEKMPVTSKDIENVQFSNKNANSSQASQKESSESSEAYKTRL